MRTKVSTVKGDPMMMMKTMVPPKSKAKPAMAPKKMPKMKSKAKY